MTLTRMLPLFTTPARSNCFFFLLTTSKTASMLMLLPQVTYNLHRLSIWNLTFWVHYRLQLTGKNKTYQTLHSLAKTLILVLLWLSLVDGEIIVDALGFYRNRQLDMDQVNHHVHLVLNHLHHYDNKGSYNRCVNDIANIILAKLDLLTTAVVHQNLTLLKLLQSHRIPLLLHPWL